MTNRGRTHEASLSPLTLCVHAGSIPDEAAGGVNTPIFTSSAFRVPGPSGKVLYPRYQNTPNQLAVSEKLAALEGGETGLVFSSGMGAITGVFFALLQAGDHVVLQRDLYGGTHHFVVSDLPRFHIDTTLVDGTEPEAFERALRPETRLLYLETPSNPLLKILDLRALGELASSRGILTAVDNTFATPVNQNPIELGIDVVIHSGTKYLNGHSDLCCGAVVTRGDLMEKIHHTSVNQGTSLNACDCYQLERSMKTLGLRMRQHNRNGLALAEFLKNHPRVRRVYYPGLPDHPGHEVAAGQMKGFGGMLSVELECDLDAARRVVSRLRLVTEAVSLGGVESLLCFPCLTSHAKVPREEREAQGISDSLIRISVGIEETADLLADFDQALEAR